MNTSVLSFALGMFVLFVSLSLSVPTAAQDDAPDVVRAGILGIIADAPFYVAEAMGYYDKFNLDVELTPFQSGADAVPALASGQLDITYTSYTAGIYNAIGRGIDIRFIAANSTQDERASTAIFLSDNVAAEMEVNPEAGLAVLEGRVIAINGMGNNAHAYVHWGLQDVRLTLDDVTLEILSVPDQLAAIESGAIAAGVFTDPLTSVAEIRGVGVRSLSAPELYGGVHDSSAVAVSADFLHNRRDVAVRMLAAYLLASRDVRRAFVLREQPIRDEVLSILSDALPSIQNPAVLERIYATGGTPNGEIDITSVQRFLDVFDEIGLIESDVNLDAAIDPTIAQDALERIGEWDYAAEAEALEAMAALAHEATPEADAQN